MDKFKLFLKTTKGKIVVGIGSIIIIIIGYVIISQIPMSTKKAYETFNTKYDLMGSDYAYDWLDDIYDSKGIFKDKERENKIEVLSMIMDEINNNFISATGGTADDYSNVEIINKEIKSGNGNYNYAYITFKNNSSKNVSYIAFNVYFYDESGECIQSDYTNDSNTVKPGAQQTVEMMYKKDSRYSKWNAEIKDIRFE